MYMDTLHAPFPAIRFKEETSEIAKIREKETGDWKKMTVEEKKALYRHSFCQVCSISQFSFSAASPLCRNAKINLFQRCLQCSNDREILAI